MFLHIESILPVVFLSIFPYAHFTGESFSPMYEKRQAQTEQERESFPTKCNAEVNDGRFSLIFTRTHCQWLTFHANEVKCCSGKCFLQVHVYVCASRKVI